MLQSTGLQKVRHDQRLNNSKFCKVPSTLPVQIKCSVIARYFCYYYQILLMTTSFCKVPSTLPVQIKCSVIASYLFFCYYYHGAVDDNKSRNTQAVLCAYTYAAYFESKHFKVLANTDFI